MNALRMAQANLEKSPRFSPTKTPISHNSPTFEQLIHGDCSTLQSSLSPTLGRHHDQEEHVIFPHSKKLSIFSRVKEKAKKLRYSFSGKKKHDDNTSPSWGVSLDDDYDDDVEKDIDPEYLGAPMYESELAPEAYKENARQHPRAIPVVSEKHILPSSIKHEAEEEKIKGAASPHKTMTETVSEKLAPAYAAVSDATHTIASKISSLTITKPEDQGKYTGHNFDQRSSEIRDQTSTMSPQSYDKGVSVKEYFMNKLEPGEDDRALSHVISEAISPRKTPGEMGVVEKVKEAVTSFLQPEESSQSASKTMNLSANNNSTSNNAKLSQSKSMSPRSMFSTGSNLSSRAPVSSSVSNQSSRAPVSSSVSNQSSRGPISSSVSNQSSRGPISSSANSSPLNLPVSTNAHEVVEEESHGRILQAN